MTSIGEASRRSGVSIETIRYYERAAIVPKPDRAENGRRVYSDLEIGRLRFVRRCRDLGFSMADAKTLLALSEGTAADCKAVYDLAIAHLAAVRIKISELARLEAALEELTSNCQSASTRCPMLEELKSA